MSESRNTNNANEKMTSKGICTLLDEFGYEYDAQDPAMINVTSPNGVFVIFTSDLPWLRISKPATVKATRDIKTLQAAINEYNISMVKFRLIDNRNGGYAIEAYLESIEPAYGHLKDTLNTYFYLLDKAFNDINELYNKLINENARHNPIPDPSTLSDRKYNLGKRGKALFWTYLVQILVVSFVACFTGFGAITGLSSHSGTIMARSPWLCYSLFLLGLIISCVAGITVIFYYKKKDKWVNWAIGMSIAMVVVSILEGVLQLVNDMTFLDFGFRHALFMITVNLAFLAFFVKYKFNLAIARERQMKEEQMEFVPTVNPMISKILFSVAIYALCIEIGFACAILMPHKAMAIIGSVLLGILAFLVILIIDRNGYDEKEELIEI